MDSLVGRTANCTLIFNFWFAVLNSKKFSTWVTAWVQIGERNPHEIFTADDIAFLEFGHLANNPFGPLSYIHRRMI
jgi:hypothetical protein